MNREQRDKLNRWLDTKGSPLGSVLFVVVAVAAAVLFVLLALWWGP